MIRMRRRDDGEQGGDGDGDGDERTKDDEKEETVVRASHKNT